MHRNNDFATISFFRIFCDMLFVVAAYLLSAFLRGFALKPGFLGEYAWLPATFIVIYVLLMFFLRMYDVTTFTYMDRMIIRVTVSVFVPSLCISSMLFLLKMTYVSRMFFGLFILLSFVLLLGERFLGRELKRASRRGGETTVLFIGRDSSFAAYKKYIEKTSISCSFDNCFAYADERINSAEKFEDRIAEICPDEVVIAYEPGAEPAFRSYMSVCEDMGITVHLIVDLFDTELSQKYVSGIGTLPVVTYHSVSKNQAQIFFKKLMDMCGAVIAVTLSSPVMLAAAVAIKLDSPGPVFFRQTRVGRSGKTFEILKFRSMYIDAEERKKELAAQNKVKGGLMFKMDDDPRVTKVGRVIRKLSIDELPQFLNVLRGQMSIVGTRPPTVDEVKLYERRHRRRISISPGITGMWQVSGRSDITDFEQVVRLDTQYIDEWNLGLDIKLIFMTVGVVLGRRGAG
ncbi:MAG: sugar transferase [Clostridiales Family XIII bacterium]|nr:sugar transferase [Clostridiales Family XIII bacterium]